MFIMKHATSRFFRFFLVAALVAAMAGSLLPTKVAGIAADDISVSVSPGAAGEASEWVITFTSEGAIVPDDGDADNGVEDDSIVLTFTGATLTVVDDDGTTTDVDEAAEWRKTLGSQITVASGGESDNPTVTAATATSITLDTPVLIGTVADADADPAVVEAGGDATITISVDAGLTHASPAAATSVEVAPRGRRRCHGHRLAHRRERGVQPRDACLPHEP